MFWWNRPEAQAWDQLDFTGKRVYVVPTMSLAYGLPALRDGDLDDPLLQHVLGVLGSTGADYWTSLRDAFSDTTHSVSKRAKHLRNVFLDGYNSDPSLIESARRTRNKTLARYQEQTEQRKTDPDLERDGMVILAGTDAQNFGVVFGYSLHQELRAMVEDVGFGTWEALESATILPGEWLGVRYGVDKDDVANLLVLDKDPTENVRNLDSIRKVIHRSKVVVSV